MRYTIAHESTKKPTRGGLHLRPGALIWDDSPIAVTYGLGVDVIGYALDIQREDDGRITAEIEFGDEPWDEVRTWIFEVYGRLLVRTGDSVSEMELVEVRGALSAGFPTDGMRFLRNT